MTDPRELMDKLRYAAKPVKELAGIGDRGAVFRKTESPHAKIMRHAADYIEQTLAAVPDEVEGLCERLGNPSGDEKADYECRLEAATIIRAQAALIAEKDKALAKIIAKDRCIVGSGRQRVESDGDCAAIARRARNAGGGA